MFDKRIKYTLLSNEFGSLELINGPIGEDESPLFWHDIPKSMERGKKRLSFITKYIDKIIFVKEGSDYLRRYFDLHAPNGHIEFRVEVKNPYTDVFEVDYQEEINMKQYEDYQEKFTVQVVSGGLDEEIDSQLSEKFELDRTTFKDGAFTKPADINGNQITDLNYEKLVVTGRRLFNRTLLENKEGFTHIAENEPGLGTITTSFISDHNIIYDSDDLVRPVIGVDGFRKVTFAGQWVLSEGQYFYGKNDRRKNLKITFSGTSKAFFRTGANKELIHYLVRAKEGNPGEYLGAQSAQIIISEFTGIQSEYTYNKTINITLEKDEVLAFVTFVTAAAGAATDYTVDEKNCSIFIEEDSEFPPTTNNALTFHEALHRTTEVILGNRNQFRSDYFKDGPYKDLLIASGKMIRNLPKLDEDRKPLEQLESITTSLKDLLSVKGYLCTGYGVEIHGGKKMLVVEELKHFFRNTVKIHLGEVYDYKESFNPDYAWRSADFGNEKAGTYEEQFGLFETNAKNVYGFPTNTMESTFDGLSKLRSDLIAVELLRRKNYEIAPTEDTSYDKENFLLDSIPENGAYRLRKWQDDLQEQPKKVYDPDSAGNFRLTPLQSLLRWGWFFGASLHKFADKFIRYSSTTGFSGMITKYANVPNRSEDGNLPINELEYARMTAVKVNCKAKLTYELKKQIEGSFEVNGRDIPNIYCLASYTYKSGETQYGWVLKSELTRDASFELIKARI
ncbi:hypothetical protein [Aquimarina macrocephali]|uniref:hypothetical protein n=1 Tax=Aquimarina macrocephali TaxID=666563 RepID=UPI003F66D492